jgi:uncharacterized RDD family membrane protein YckC
MQTETILVKTPEYVSLQFQPAGLGSRAGAIIIDQLILMVFNLASILLFIFYASSAAAFFLDDTFLSWPFAIMLICLFLVNWGYFFVFEYFWAGRTPGKKIMGIRVIQDNGQSITLLSSFIRNLLRIIDSLPVYYLLGILMVFFHSRHKRVGDLAAGTVVIHERKKKKAGKMTEVEKEIQARGLKKEDLHMDEWTLRKIGAEEWKLLKTYSERLLHLPIGKREELTKKLSNTLLPKLNIDPERKSFRQLEDILLVLYLISREEWEFEDFKK